LSALGLIHGGVELESPRFCFSVRGSPARIQYTWTSPAAPISFVCSTFAFVHAGLSTRQNNPEWKDCTNLKLMTQFSVEFEQHPDGKFRKKPPISNWQMVGLRASTQASIRRSARHRPRAWNTERVDVDTRSVLPMRSRTMDRRHSFPARPPVDTTSSTTQRQPTPSRPRQSVRADGGCQCCAGPRPCCLPRCLTARCAVCASTTGATMRCSEP